MLLLLPLLLTYSLSGKARGYRAIAQHAAARFLSLLVFGVAFFCSPQRRKPSVCIVTTGVYCLLLLLLLLLLLTMKLMRHFVTMAFHSR